jgi:DNA-binding HxlR family transcriptional regulator
MPRKTQQDSSQVQPVSLPVSESGCPVDSLVSLIMGPWTAYIVWVLLQHKSIRFSVLMKEVHGISARMLTVRLRRLESFGLVLREQHLGIPPHVRYELTARGR